jgi:Protein of unknown function (DUF4054)
MSGSGVVAFDQAYFAARFPELFLGQSPLAGYYFQEAGVILNNTPSSVVSDSSVGGRRYILLHLLAAHIAALNLGSNGQGTSASLVGRIASATEGSVNVSVDMGTQPAAAAYFNQTRYGAQFWAMTSDLRTASYVGGSGRRRFIGFVG